MDRNDKRKLITKVKGMQRTYIPVEFERIPPPGNSTVEDYRNAYSSGYHEAIERVLKLLREFDKKDGK